MLSDLYLMWFVFIKKVKNKTWKGVRETGVGGGGSRWKKQPNIPLKRRQRRKRWRVLQQNDEIFERLSEEWNNQYMAAAPAAPRIRCLLYTSNPQPRWTAPLLVRTVQFSWVIGIEDAERRASRALLPSAARHRQRSSTLGTDFERIEMHSSIFLSTRSASKQNFTYFLKSSVAGWRKI